MIITGDIERFHYFNFETRFLKKRKVFCKELKYWILVQITTIGTATFPKNHPCLKPILRQIVWGIQNGPVTKNEVFSLTPLFS